MQFRRTEARRLSERCIEQPEPVFLRGRAGPVFAVHHAPKATTAAPYLIYLPPFAEEMNRARRMAALQARAFAAIGIGVLLVDPFGCGDSAGDFAEARWSIWRDDVAVAADWLMRHGAASLGLWGLRLGALLAADAARAEPGRYDRLLLWQPVISGQGFLTQFLRIRMAGGLTGQGKTETTAQLRRRLNEGTPLEVAGYRLAPELAAAIDDLRLDEIGHGVAADIYWFEVTGSPEPSISVAGADVVATWRRGGIHVETDAVAGEPFWSTPEITTVPALIDACTRRSL